MNSTPPGVALVSGATGFLGRHLVRRLDREGWRVHVLLRPASDAAPLKSSPHAGSCPYR